MKQKFSKAFWVANTVELLERLAYYAVFIVITLYLSNIWGFSDIEAGMIAGIFSACLYLLPTFVGAYADKIGFRASLITAFSLLSVGYVGLGILPTLLESRRLGRIRRSDPIHRYSDFVSALEHRARFGADCLRRRLHQSSHFGNRSPRNHFGKPSSRLLHFLYDGKHRRLHR